MSSARRLPVGLLPAAGRGTRLHPYRAPKELLPLALRSERSPDEVVPTPVCMFALRALRRAGVERCVVAISDGKQDLIRTLGDGGDQGLSLAYLHQAEPRGLTDVVRRAAPWLGDHDVVFAMPDTVFFPEDGLAILHRQLVDTGADIMLGLFHADEPERLGAVHIDGRNTVLEIHDKPGHRQWPWCWGVLAWSVRFTRFCAQWEEARGAGSEGVLGHAMEAARRAGLVVRAHCFTEGLFHDVGTPAGLGAAMRALVARGVIFGTST
ncbi:MAG: sugar phosphate nucleotidyltransferase [Myxococcota bacterium]